jgi:hypothetical protein
VVGQGIWQGIVSLLLRTDLIDAMTLELPSKLRDWAPGKFAPHFSLEAAAAPGWLERCHLASLDHARTRGGYPDYYHQFADSDNYFVTKLAITKYVTINCDIFPYLFLKFSY